MKPKCTVCDMPVVEGKCLCYDNDQKPTLAPKVDMKVKAMRLVKEMSNNKLGTLLRKLGKNVDVNLFTRGTVERRIKEKLDDYTDEQIQEFINNNL